MLSALLLPLMLSAAHPANPAVAAAARTDDPSIRVTLDEQWYERGDRARVTVHVRDDGYVVVLHVTPTGLVRVLFPIDPGDDNFVRGGQTYAVQGRGGEESFTVENGSGTGTVYAAWSGQPFHFDEYARDGHWDYRFVGDSALPADPETGFTNLVQHMATGHFDYDLVTYNVQRRSVAYASPDYYVPATMWYDPYWANPYWAPGFFGVSVGWGFGYNPWYTPWYYGYGYGYGYGYPYGYGYGYGYGYPGYYYPPYIHQPRYYANNPFSGYHWKGGVIGGGGAPGVQYRPRGFVGAGAGVASSPLYTTSRFASGRGGVTWRTPGVFRPTQFTGRGGVSPRPGEFVGRRPPVYESPTGVPMRDRPMMPESRSDRPASAPARVSRPEAPTRAAAPSRVESPRSAPTRVESPRSAPTRVESPRAAPAPRVSEPRSAPSRRPEMRYDMAPRYDAPQRYQPPERIETRSPSYTPARSYEPRAEPRASAPRMSAPRMSAPRASAPHFSAPSVSRGGGWGGGGHGGGGGGGGHHH